MSKSMATTPSLAPGETTSFTIDITVPATITTELVEEVTITVISESNSQKRDEIVNVLQVILPKK